MVLSQVKVWLKAIRVHQWLKNVLIFVPLVAGHQFQNSAAILPAILAFASFSLCASGAYIINDLKDIEADRIHPTKHKRPFASGKIEPAHGYIAAIILLVVSAVIAFQVSWTFVMVLATYCACTFAYTFRLKSQVIVDVLLLASLYTLRILAGAAATQIVPSFWLLAFSMFVFLSLALVKRYSEMVVVEQQGKKSAAGRGYLATDSNVLLSLGSAAGYNAVLVLALYINSPDTEGLYPNRWSLWLLLPPILYWMTRIWLKAHRGEVHDDPLVFAVKDPQSWVVAVLAGAALVVATLTNA